MKLIKSYNGKETEIEYPDLQGSKLLQAYPYDPKSAHATFKAVGEPKLQVGQPAVIEHIEVSTVFSKDEALNILENKSYKDLKELYKIEYGEKAPNNIKKTVLIDKLIEKADD